MAPRSPPAPPRGVVRSGQAYPLARSGSHVHSCGRPETGYGANLEVFARAAAAGTRGRGRAAPRSIARAGLPPTGEPRRGTRLDRGGSATQSLRTVCAPRGRAYENAAAASAAAPRITQPQRPPRSLRPHRPRAPLPVHLRGASPATPPVAPEAAGRGLRLAAGSFGRSVRAALARVVERLTGPGSRRGLRHHGAAPVEHRRVRDEGQGALRQRPREGAIRAQIQAPRGHHDPARNERRAGACVPAPPPRAPRRAREGERRRATRADVLDGETPARSGSSTRRTRPPSSDDSRRSSSGSWPPCAAATSRRSPPSPRRRRPPRPRRRRSDETAGKNAKARRGRLFWPRRRAALSRWTAPFVTGLGSTCDRVARRGAPSATRRVGGTFAGPSDGVAAHVI